MLIRPFAASDIGVICEIYYRSVREVASSKYDAAQLAAWAPAVPDTQRFTERLAGLAISVAEDDAGVVVGWIAVSATGYIDMLFCLPQAVGRGYAAALYDVVESDARTRGLRELTAHASLLAEPFFAKRGWCVDEREIVVRADVGIPRAVMSRQLR